MLPVDVRGCHLLAAEPVEQLLLGAGRRVRQPAIAYPDQAAPIVLPDRGVWGAKEQILWLISGVKPLSGNFWIPLASWIIQFLPESLHLLVKCFAQSLAIPIHPDLVPLGGMKIIFSGSFRHFLDDTPLCGASKKYRRGPCRPCGRVLRISLAHAKRAPSSCTKLDEEPKILTALCSVFC
jgi:hypothetical protein